MKTMISMGLKYHNNKLIVLDQTLLPHEELWIESKSPDDMVGLIQRLAVRGAPLIGVAAALALAKFAEEGATQDAVVSAARKLRDARPTAVNLMAAVDRLFEERETSPFRAKRSTSGAFRLPSGQRGPGWPPRRAPSGQRDGVQTQSRHSLSPDFSPGSVHSIVAGAEAIFDEDVALCHAMAERGAALIQDGDSVLTHCNSGGLATAGIGTALGVIRKAHEQGKRIHVYVDETRPLLQGARLTAWELSKVGIPFTLICDNMAGFLMSQGKVNKIFVGADRIAANGDFANKIGTYGLAVLARHHQVPFYTVAPSTTLDLNCKSGKEIPIEQRPADEVRAGKSPAGCLVWNPAFDVTPRELITGVVLNDRMM